MFRIIIGLILFFATSIVNAELQITSPTDVCNLLNKLGLSTGGWKDNYGYGCNSPYKEIGSGYPLANNLAYYVDGSISSVSEVKLVININNKSSAKSAHKALLDASHVLSKRLSGKDLPKSIISAIESGKASSHNIGKTVVDVVRFDWPTGRGYEVKVIFK
jgi:hypothetical protein